MSINDWITIIVISWFVVGFVLSLMACMIMDQVLTVGDILVSILFSIIGYFMIPLFIIMLVARSSWKNTIIWKAKGKKS